MRGNFLHDYEIVCQNNEVPATFHLYSSLVALSAIVSGRVWLDLGLFKIRPNIYVILTGPPGVKKTTAMTIAKRLLREVGHAKVPLSAECQTKEALVLDMAGNTKVCKGNKPGTVPKLWAIDENRTQFSYSPMTVCVTEVSQFVGSSNASHMLDFLTSIYDEEVYKNSTKGKGTDFLPLPYFVFLGCTVPDWLTSRLKEDAITGGFSRRTIFVYENVTSKRIAFPEVTQEMEDAWVRLVKKARHLLNVQGEYEWGPGARDFYENWYNNLTRPTDPLLDGWYNSVHVQMLKIAMLIAVSTWETGAPVLHIQHMELAIQLLRMVEANIPRVFKNVGRNELYGISNKIIELLETAPKRELPERFIKRELFREADISELTKIIGHLISTKQVLRVNVIDPMTKTNQPYLRLCQR